MLYIITLCQKQEGGDSIEYEWERYNTEEKIRLLSAMDNKAEKVGDSLTFSTYWKETGAGWQGTEEETESKKECIAKDDKLFANALFSFAITIISVPDWTISSDQEEED